MSTSQATMVPTTESEVFARLLENGHGAMPVSLARYILKLSFNDNDRARMTDLAFRNQEGQLSEIERQELDSYVRAGHMLAMLQSRARRVIRAKARP